MIRRNFSIVALSFVLMTSCEQGVKFNEAITTQTTNQTTMTDENGNKLAMNFDNEEDIVVIDFNGETEKLKRKKSASGIWYANDHYELSGKGNDITLKKDGNVVFEHKDDIVTVQSKNNAGDVLDLTFNNTQGTVKAYLNGGEEITMLEQKAASGFWYLNEDYELRGKGEDYTLTKDGKVIFEHTDDVNTVQTKNSAGDVLDLTFNNDAGTVKAYLNGGEQIDLKEQKAASGIWYTNDQYELSGKGSHYELKKGDEVIFKN